MNMRLDEIPVFRVSNGYRYYLFSIPITVGNLLLMNFWNISMTINILLILCFISSYLILASIVLRRVYFFSNRFEISYVFRFSIERKVFWFDQIAYVNIIPSPRGEMPLIVVWMKNRSLPITVCYFSYEKIEKLKELLHIKSVKFKISN